MMVMMMNLAALLGSSLDDGEVLLRGLGDFPPVDPAPEH